MDHIVGAVGEIVVVLNANYWSNGLGLGELRWRDIAETKMTDAALALQAGQDAKGLCDGFLKGIFAGAYSKVDDVESFETEVLQVVVDGEGELVL
jgi:hypothetical protein